MQFFSSCFFKIVENCIESLTFTSIANFIGCFFLSRQQLLDSLRAACHFRISSKFLVVLSVTATDRLNCLPEYMPVKQIAVDTQSSQSYDVHKFSDRVKRVRAFVLVCIAAQWTVRRFIEIVCLLHTYGRFPIFSCEIKQMFFELLFDYFIAIF